MKLRVLDSENLGEFPLVDDVVTIGRTPANTIQLNDPSTSKEHAQVVPDHAGWRLVDGDSRNGTYVNGHRIQSHRLEDGDRIRIGQVDLLVIGQSSARLVVDEPVAGTSSRANMTSVPVFEPINLDDEPALRIKKSLDHALERMPEALALAETKLRLIQAIGEKLIQYTDSEELAEEILSIVIKQTAADRGFLCLFNQQGEHVPLASAGLESGEEMRLSRTVLNRLRAEKSGVLVRPDESGDPDIASLKRMSVKSTLCVPLWMTDKIMGFISLDSTTVGKAFTTEHLGLLIAIAHQAAIGLERGRLVKRSAQEAQLRTYLSKYLDTKLVQHIVENADPHDDPLAPQEREVTVMFADIVSFTKMSEEMEPTELAGFLRKYLTAMTDIIFTNGGTIDKYIGDAIMALFGAPVANEHAAVDAVQAALAMKECVQKQHSGLRITVGISTGPAVIGNIGSEQRTEYTAIGDTVNVAARLQAFARPNEICIEEETCRQARDAVEVEEIGTIDVKNRKEPVQVYKVLNSR